MSFRITVGAAVYVAGKGVGNVVSRCSGKDEDEHGVAYWKVVLFGSWMFVDAVEVFIFRAVPSFVGWFYEDAGLHRVPDTSKSYKLKHVAGRMSTMAPNLQNLPIRRKGSI